MFLHECQEAGLTSATVHAGKILPMNRIADDRRKVALDLVDDPLQELMQLFEGHSAASSKESRVGELAKSRNILCWNVFRGASSTLSATGSRTTSIGR